MMAGTEYPQITMDDLLGIAQAGAYVVTHGRRLTFEEAARKLGQPVVLSVSTESGEWYKIVIPMRMVQAEDGERRLVCDRGGGRCYLSERAFRMRRSYRGKCLPEYGTEVYEA